MNRGAHNELTKKGRDAEKAGASANKPRGTTARKLIEHAAGWAGDDLEEIIEVVAATRAKSRF